MAKDKCIVRVEDALKRNNIETVKAEDIINPEKEGMSKANVYKVIKILKAEGVIEDETN